MNIDLAGLDPSNAANDGYEFEVLHPVTQEKTGALITVLGLESDAGEELRSAQMMKAQRAMQRAGRLLFDSLQAAKDKRIDFCVELTKSWTGMTYKGADLPYSKANARMLYSQLSWLLNQVDEAIADPANFIPS